VFGVYLGLGEALILLSGGGWGVFIALNHHIAIGESVCRWAHRTVRCASHVTQLLGFWRFRPLELWLLGAPESPMSHRTGTIHCLVCLLAAALTLRKLSAHCSRCRRPLRWLAIAPLAHQTVRWIIAKRLSRNPKVASLKSYSPGHRTVRCARPGFSLVSFAPFFWTLTLIFLLVCVEPLAPVEHII
jgi:hypothetical protein